MTIGPSEVVQFPVPELIGSAETSTAIALRIAAPKVLLTDEQQETLGGSIYLGNLAAQRIAEAKSDIPHEDLRVLKTTAQVGLKAREVVAYHFLPLVLSMSRRFAFDGTGRYDPQLREDMIAAGNLALVAAMPGYIHIAGRPYSSYAKTCVRRAMVGEAMQLRRESTGLSIKMQRLLADANTERSLSIARGQDISLLEAATMLGYKPGRAKRAIQLSKVATVSLDGRIFGDDDDFVMLDTTPDETAEAMLNDAENGVLLAQVFVAAHDLRRRQVISDKEWRIFVARYGEGQTQQQIADANDVGIETQSGVQAIENRVLGKIRKHIEDPTYYEKLSRSNYRIAESAVDLLNLLQIPINPKTDVLGVASNIIDNLRLTMWQREVMRSLLGLDGRHYRPHELAKERSRTYRAIYAARERAIENILNAWNKMSLLEQREAVTRKSENINVAPSMSPRPNTSSSTSATPIPKLDMATIITRAVQLKPGGVLTKAEIGSYAEQGLLPDVQTIAITFGGWSSFQALVRQLRQLA